MDGDDYSDIHLTVAQGTYYGNQLNLGDICGTARHAAISK